MTTSESAAGKLPSRNGSPTKGAIALAAKELCDAIQQYSMSQAEIWRLIPTLAKSADGKLGWSDQLKQAHTYKIWDIESRKRIAVDLRTGRLIKWVAFSKAEDAPQDEVFYLASRLDLLDARTIACALRKEACQSIAHTTKKNPPPIIGEGYCDWCGDAKTDLQQFQDSAKVCRSCRNPLPKQ